MSSTMLSRIIQVISGNRYRWAAEFDLQRSIADVLTGAGLDVVREFVLEPGSRVDVWVPAARIGIEVKVKDSLATVTRQLARYAATGVPGELLLVTTRATHQAVPRFVPGPTGPIPVRVLFLSAVTG